MMNVEFLEALEEIAREEGIEREELYKIVAKGLEVAYRIEHETAKEIRVEIDRNSGEIKIIADGEEAELNIRDFGRIAARRAEETIRQEIIRRRREIIYERYAPKVGELISGAVHRFEGGRVWLNLGRAEALLAEEERIPGERYRPGEQLRAYLFRVEKTQGDPRILVSRAHPKFVERLLELEVPELGQGLVKVEAIAREPGVRTRLAVSSASPEIDPVGTCIGPNGIRVRAVVRELGGEKVEVIRWSEDVRELIKSCLEPARVLEIEIDEGERKARVVVPDDELSLAIGKGGHNTRLTAQLTGYAIEVTSPKELQAKTETETETETERAANADRV